MITLKLTARSLRTRYDVVHIHNMPNLLIFTALLPRLLGAKLILDIHDLMPEVYMSRHQCGRNHLVVRMLRLEERVSVCFAHAIITACHGFRDALEQRGINPSRLTVVYNVPDPSIFRRDLVLDSAGRRDVFTMIYPGTFNPRYGLAVAIRALPILAERIGRVRLLLLGAFMPHVTELLSLADELGVSSLIEYRGGVPLGELPVALGQADVGIYTALPDPHMNIAVPGKVLEYAVMGIPIVASRLKVLESLFPPSALMFFEPGDEHQFAECILQLYANPERRAELVRLMDESYVQTHTWRDEMGAYFELLNRLLAGKACVQFVSAGPPKRLEASATSRAASAGESL
jgi:glycosyltransferase involved in cell wall biosynthesis